MAKKLNPQDYIGKKYGKLTIFECVGKDKHGWYLMKCKCDCGNESIVNIHRLRNNHTKSCGCNVKSRGFRNNKLRKSYLDMINRCSNPKCSHYLEYGERGISICDEWKVNWESFKNWALKNGYVEGLTLDRIDVNGNYEPDNCRWVNMHVQAANKRISRNNRSKYCGVGQRTDNGKWRARIRLDYRLITLGCYATKKEAVEARNRFIIENNLTEYPIQEWKGA